MSKSLLLVISLLALLFLFQKSVGEEEEDKDWCIADEQGTDEALQAALNWACGKANCSEIQENKSCYLPNTLVSHASFAFNAYFQTFKHSGASCYFKASGLLTQLDPSYNSCHYEFLP